ncbi:MAG: hypothetical protein ACHQ50_16130, partial [Fimbriimonadales bacterium]
MRFCRGLTVLAGPFILCAAVPALAGGTAADLLKALVDFRGSLYGQAQERAKGDSSKVDMAAIQQRIKAKAEEDIKGIDPAKVVPGESFEWAQIFNYAGRPREAAGLLRTFIGAKPDPVKLYEAQEMLLSVSWVTKDDKTVSETLQSMKPFDVSSGVDYADLVVRYGPYEVREMGADGAAA